MGVHAQQLKRWLGQHAADGVGGVTRRKRETKLLVLMGSGDVLVGMGFNADSHSDENLWRRPARFAASTKRSISTSESMTILPTPASTAVLEFLFRLVIAVEKYALRGELGIQGDRQLTSSRDVYA